MSYVRLCHHKSVLTVSLQSETNVISSKFSKKHKLSLWLDQQLARAQSPSEGCARGIAISSPAPDIFDQHFAAIVTETSRHFSRVISSIQYNIITQIEVATFILFRERTTKTLAGNKSPLAIFNHIKPRKTDTPFQDKFPDKFFLIKRNSSYQDAIR